MIHLRVLLAVLVWACYCSYSYSQELVSVVIVPATSDPVNPSGPSSPSQTYVFINDCVAVDTCEPSESTVTDNTSDTLGVDDILTLSGQTIYRTEIGVNDLATKDRPIDEVVIDQLGNNQVELIAKIETVSLKEYEQITLEQIQLRQAQIYQNQVVRQPSRALRNGLAQQLLHEQLIDSQYRN